MKRVWFALAALAVITAACLLSDWYVTRQSASFLTLVDRAEQQAQQGSPEQALTTMEQLQEQWDRQATLMGSLIRHAEIDEAEQTLARALACLRTGQLDTYYLESDSLRSMLQQMDEMETFSLQNLL